MGTSEEVRVEHQHPRQRLHAQYQLDHHQQHAPAAFPLMTQAPQGQTYHVHHQNAGTDGSSWPHNEKLSESDLAHASHDMEVDPSHDANDNQHESMSPSPTNHHYANSTNANGHSVFHFGDHQQSQQNQQSQQQTTFAGLVATPITRFLTKQTFGFIPKPSFPSPSDGVGSMPPRSAPSSPVPGSAGNGKIPSLRLPSLLNSTNSANNSPLASPQGSFSLPVGETLSRLFNSASLGSANSAPGTPTPSSPLPPRSSTVVLPPLKRACLSPTTTLPPLAQQLSLEDICKPFRYQRSMSCPSDAMVRGSGSGMEHSEQDYEQEHHHDAYAAPRVMLQHADVPKYRVERSNSVDVSAVLAMREAHHRALHGGGESRTPDAAVDFHGWLDRSQTDRHPLASLAESAHAMQRLEQNRASHPEPESPRSIASGDNSGDESANPFDVSDSSDLRREKKLCAFPHCASNAVTRGLCISHGGGRRCQRKGCTRGAQSKGLCVAHGGGRICKAKGCSNIQRSMGLCIRHGGGKRCSVSGCQKGVVRQDLCTAHGGKRKCKVEDCNKHVKKKGLCRSHANSVLGMSAVSSPRGAMSPEYSS